VAQALHIASYQARDYTERRQEELLAGEAAHVLSEWTAEYAETAADLAHLALNRDGE
jgi:hypothetical protein